MKYPIITISREVCSGGHAIGEKVAEVLGVPFLDKDIIAEVSKTTGLDTAMIEKASESGSLLSKYINGRFVGGVYLGDEQDKVYYAQKKVILENAAKGPCVIVGRCAGHILKEAGIPCLNIFIHADFENRLENYRKQHEGQNIDFAKQLRKEDKGRQFYCRYYGHHELGDSTCYDMVLDTGAFDEAFCVDTIVKAATKAAETNKEAAC